MSEISRMNRLFQNFIELNTGIKATALISKDGETITSYFAPGLDARSIGSITSMMEYLDDRIALEFDTGFFRSSFIETDSWNFIFRQVTDSVFMSIIEKEADLAEIAPYVDTVTKLLDRLLQDPGASTDIPKPKAVSKEEKKIAKREFVYKIIIIGDGGCGKTAMTVQFAEDRFTAMYKPTIGVNIVKKDYWLEDSLIHFLIFDIAGQETWTGMRQMYYAGTQGALILYDVTNKETFDNIDKWIAELEQFTKARKFPLILVGNKVDLEDQRMVSHAEGRDQAIDITASFFESSAKTGYNVENAFKFLAAELIRDYED